MSLSDILKNLGITTKNTIISGALNAISTDNKCGPNNNNTKCPSGLCCSSNGWCGKSDEYCVNSSYKSYDGDKIYDGNKTINYSKYTNDNSMNLEKINLNINNFSNDLKPLNITNDKYTEFLNNAKNKLFDNNTFPYNKDINENTINNFVENIILKRACCMRKDKSDKYNSIKVNLYDNVDKKIKSFDIYIDKLDEKCMINSQDYSPKTLSCDNFYKAYCKMLKSYNYDLTSDKENYNKNIKYSSNKDNTNGLECSCLNSPLYEYNNDDIKENTIYHMDKACVNGVNNNTSYETDTISKNKVATLNICNINLGNYSEAAGMYIS